MILKDYYLEKNPEKIKQYKSLLIYGVNQGARDEHVLRLKNYNKSNEIINIFEEEIIKNNELLYGIIANNSLFSKSKIIFIYEVTDKILVQFEECYSKLDENINLCLLANNLDRKSKLRGLFEKSKELAIVPLYEDTEKGLHNYVLNALKGYKGLSAEVCNLIISNSNKDRKIIKNEIEKIKLFFNDKIIKKDLLDNLLNIKKESEFDEIKNMAILGEKTKLNKLLAENSLNKEDFFFFLNSLNFKFKRIKELLTTKDKNIEYIINNAKPAIFWKEKPILSKQLNMWSKKNIDKIIRNLNETEILVKKNSQIESLIILNNLLINICKEATS